MNIPSRVEQLNEFLAKIDNHNSFGFFHASNAIYQLINQNETALIADALRIGFYDGLKRILLVKDSEAGAVVALSHDLGDMVQIFCNAKDYIAKESEDIFALAQEFMKLAALTSEICGSFTGAMRLYTMAEMHEKATEMSTKVQLKPEEREKVYPTAEGIEKWKHALQEFTESPAVKNFITKQGRDVILQKIRTRVVQLLAAIG